MMPMHPHASGRLRPAGPSVSRRRGFNLVELMFAISAVSALSVLAMTVVAMLMTAEQHSAEALWIDVVVANFAHDLRRDAHAAIGLEATPDEAGRVSQVTLIEPDDVRVVYECTSEGVVRRQMHNDSVQAQDAYRLAFGTSRFAPVDADGRLIWTHTRDVPSIGGFSAPDASVASPQRTYQVTAAVGLHKALSQEDER